MTTTRERLIFTDQFVRSAAMITEVREGEFVMHGQTWRFVRRADFTLPDEAVLRAALYERVAEPGLSIGASS